MGNSIGGRIKELRLLQGMTQEKLRTLWHFRFIDCQMGIGLCIRIWNIRKGLQKFFGMRIDDFYINLDTPVTQDYILSGIKKENSKLDLEEQKYVLQVIQGVNQIKTPQLSIE